MKGGASGGSGQAPSTVQPNARAASLAQVCCDEGDARGADPFEGGQMQRVEAAAAGEVSQPASVLGKDRIDLDDGEALPVGSEGIPGDRSVRSW